MDNLKVVVDGETKELVFREGQAKPIFIYQGFKHTALSTDSFIALVKAKADGPNTVVAYNQAGFNAILDDKVIDRDQDRIRYAFAKSIQCMEWLNFLGAVNQQNFIKFLKRRADGEVDFTEELMAALQNFKFVTNISGDFTFDDRNNYTFAIKVGEAEGFVRVPQMIIVNMEILNESGFTQQIEVEIEVVLPKSESEKPVFNLVCPKWERYYRDAVQHEVDKLKEALSGWLIINGEI